MTVLSKIRNRAGLLIGIIGLALLAFVLQDAASNSARWKASSNDVGEIAGRSISYPEFNSVVLADVNRYKEQSQGKVDPSVEDMIMQQTWTKMVEEIVMGKEYEKLGLSVGMDELYDLMVDHPGAFMNQQFRNQQTGKVDNPRFADANGNLDPAKLRAFIGDPNIKQEEEDIWKTLEKGMRETRIKEKYFNLLKKAMYVTNDQAKMEYIAQNKQYNVRYIGKRYSTLADSMVKVTDDDLRAYYNKHQNDYKQDYETRSVEYVAFEATPTMEDIDALKKDADRVGEEFKTKTRAEDSSFVLTESSTNNFDITYHKKGTLSPLIDSMMMNEKIGFVYGPYEENNSYKVAKLIGVKTAADSAKVRHILVALQPQNTPNVKRTKEQAKAMADSLAKLIREKKVKFEDLVKTSDDPGSIEKGGDYGWFNASSGFVEPFKDAGLLGKKGDLTVVETQFGYHIIEVLDRSTTDSKTVQVAVIEKKIEPSAKTLQTTYSKTSEFAGKNNTAELFAKAIDDQKMNKRVADNIKLGDKTIPGLESPREMVRWAYDLKREIGDVSEAFDVNGNRFVVAVLTKVREKGIAPLDIVKDEITPKAIQDKKAEMFIKEMTEALAGVGSIDELARKTKLSVEKMDAMYFNTYSLQGYGREDVVVGTAVGSAVNKLSKPLQGKTAVFVLVVDAIKEAPVAADYNNIKTQTASQSASRIDYEVFDALKEKANIVDNKGKFY